MTVWHQFALGDNEASLFKLTLFFFILTTVILWFTQFEENKELIVDPFFFNNSNDLRAKENQSEDTGVNRLLDRFPVMLWFK